MVTSKLLDGKCINFVNHPEMIRLKISLNKNIIIKKRVWLEECNNLF